MIGEREEYYKPKRSDQESDTKDKKQTKLLRLSPVIDKVVVVYDYHKIMGLVDTYSTIRVNNIIGEEIVLYTGYKDTYKGKLIIQKGNKYTPKETCHSPLSHTIRESPNLLWI